MTARLMKALLLAVGTLSIALGVLGIFLPLLPATVFLLLGAACYARSSERVYRRLLNSPWLGSYIRNHREGRGITRRQKVAALALLWASIGGTMAWSVDAIWLRVLLGAIATGVTVHVIRIPAFRASAQPESAA